MNVSIENLLEPRTDKNGRLFIKGTRMSVHRIARWWRMGLNGEDIHREFPHLSLAQIHAALTYYFANQKGMDAEIDAAIAEERRLAEEHQKLKQTQDLKAARV